MRLSMTLTTPPTALPPQNSARPAHHFRTLDDQLIHQYGVVITQ